MLQPGEKAPDFTLKDENGDTVRLADSAGTVRLVDFWATWCAPCRTEIPMFRELRTAFPKEGFTLLTVAMDDPRDPIAPFVKENGIDYPVLLGTEERQDAFGGVVGYPTKFLLDRDGKIRASWIGPVPRKVLEEKIRELLAA